MTAFQGIIHASRSRISYIEPKAGGVTIINDTHTHTFPNAYLLPGLVDSHAHILGLGMKLTGLALYDCKSVDEIIERCSSYSMRRGEWLYAMGWNHELWDVPILPSKDQLDSAFPDTPVYLRRADGHAAWVNSAALSIAGINTTTPDPDGGSIIRNATGEAAGLLVDNAMLLVENIIPPLTAEQTEDCIRVALQSCIEQGLTEIHDMDVSPELIDIYRSLAEQGQLPCRVLTWVRGQHGEWLREGVLPAIGEFHHIVGVKFFADGALGSRGAALLEPYTDAQESNGLFLIDADTLYKYCCQAIEQGFHIATHAIGDAANRMVLDVYERLRKESVAGKDTLLRIEHSQIVHPDDLPRFGQYSITAPVQAIHCTSDALMAEKRLGKRCEYAYPWRSLRNQGINISGGSDFPIESNNPFLGIDAFVRRVPPNATESWQSHERISREEAVRAYTSSAHEAGDVAYRRGDLQVGYDADFTIIDRDIFTCDDSDIATTKVVATFTAGIARYQRKTQP